MSEEIIRGSRNIFKDLGLPDAETHFLKAQIVGRIFKIIRERELTQTQAAKIMKIKQPDVSKLLRGRFRGYSLERLMDFLNAFDQDVNIVVKPKPKSRAARTELRIAVS